MGEVKYIYKAMANYYSTLTDARRALKMDGWTPTRMKEAAIKIYKINVKTQKIVKTYSE
jgi:hypothetical protein